MMNSLTRSLSRLALSIFLAPVLYTLVARKDDILKV